MSGKSLDGRRVLKLKTLTLIIHVTEEATYGTGLQPIAISEVEANEEVQVYEYSDEAV